MKRLSITLNEEYKSFPKGSYFEIHGDLIIFSGVNGVGKSQLLNIILGKDNYVKNEDNVRREQFKSIKINSDVFIDKIKIDSSEIDYRSFKDNVLIQEIKDSNSTNYTEGLNKVWQSYSSSLLDSKGNPEYSKSLINAKEILLKKFNIDNFYDKGITEQELRSTLIEFNFQWQPDDLFSNTIGNLFFNHAVEVSEEMKVSTRANFDSSKFKLAPWEELNKLFSELNFDYRFKDNYELKGVTINEQPQLYSTDQDGQIDINRVRKLSDLSDGEKAIISLLFASLSSNTKDQKKILLLDEYDAVLNPSLIHSFFNIVKRYFVDKGTLVIISTHSTATLSFAPPESVFYEIFKESKNSPRIIEIPKEQYSEMQIVNKEFYDKIKNQEERINSLQGRIDSSEDILIITEGKTDWKYILKALEYFHSINEFESIKADYFYKFGSKEDLKLKECGTNAENELSDSKLINYLRELESTRKIEISQIQKIRIGIFDSDNSSIKLLNSKEKGIYSMKISPEGISTEFLFNDSELKTEIDSRRLYIGKEFDSRSHRHITESNINIGDGSANINKAGKNIIVEHGVFKSSTENIALSKENFAKAVYNGNITISSESWEKFRHIFEFLESIIKTIDNESKLIKAM